MRSYQTYSFIFCPPAPFPNHQLPVLGAFVVNLAGTPTEVLVVEKLGDDALLGGNLLKGAVIDMLGRILRLGDQTFPISIKPVCPVMATSCLPKADSETLNNVLKAYSDVFSNIETPIGVLLLFLMLRSTQAQPTPSRHQCITFHYRKERLWSNV